MLTLGAHGKSIAQDIALAQQLAETCVNLYLQQPTKLGPERVRFNFNKAANDDASSSSPSSDRSTYSVVSAKYLLRPETIESLFYLWRKTHNEIYRDWGWQILLAIEEHCKTPIAYSGMYTCQQHTHTHTHTILDRASALPRHVILTILACIGSRRWIGVRQRFGERRCCTSTLE
jgi:hypothetical protein